MSDVSKREWRFYLNDMIEFAGKVLAYTDGLSQDDMPKLLPMLKALKNDAHS